MAAKNALLILLLLCASVAGAQIPHAHVYEHTVDLDDTVAVLERTARKDVANGYAGLDGSGQISVSAVPSTVARTDQGNTYTSGTQQKVEHDATTAGLRLATGPGDPSGAGNGDIWYNSSTNKFRAYENGAATDLIAGGGGGGDNVTVNGSAVTDADLDDSTPAAPAGAVNVTWQTSGSGPADVSAYITITDLLPAGVMMPFAGASGSVPTGWLLADGGTIGNASSGGTARANADTQTLFEQLWNDFTNTELPIEDSGGSPTTRGGSASADFSANKRMPLPDIKGNVIVGYDSGDTNFDAEGETGGAATHTLTTAEMPTHNHSVTDPGHTHTQHALTSTSGADTRVRPDNSSSGDQSTSTSTASATTGLTVDNAGSGNAHNNLQPYIALNYIIKY